MSTQTSVCTAVQKHNICIVNQFIVSQTLGLGQPLAGCTPSSIIYDRVQSWCILAVLTLLLILGLIIVYISTSFIHLGTCTISISNGIFLVSFIQKDFFLLCSSCSTVLWENNHHISFSCLSDYLIWLFWFLFCSLGIVGSSWICLLSDCITHYSLLLKFANAFIKICCCV